MKTILLRSKNVSATEFYYNIIHDALTQCSELIFDGFEGEAFPDDKDAIIVVGSCMSMMRVWRMGHRKIITWFQGVLPEESYMRNHSRIRCFVLEQIEKFALKSSLISIVVSNALKEHYEKKYHIDLKRYYVMPCFNTEYQEEAIREKNYSKMTFTYTGGLSKWQCIDQTMALYKRIEKASGGRTKLLILTPEQDKATEMVKQYGIQNAEIAFVHYTALPAMLHNVSFGFALREDNAVNRVATPTKLANYISNGIIPIYTKCVLDFASVSGDNPYQIMIDDVNNISDAEVEAILELAESQVSSQQINHEFRKYFEQYYNAVWHTERIAECIMKAE